MHSASFQWDGIARVREGYSLATQAPEKAATFDDMPSSFGPRRKSGNKKLLLLAGVFAVMLIEAIVVYVLVPKSAGANPGESSDASVGSLKDPADAQNVAEVKIDDFNVTNSLKSSGDVIHVNATIAAVVGKSQKDAFELAVSKESKHRVRQAVLKVLRSSSLEDLSDPENGTIKRQVREEINKVLGKSYVIQIIISDMKIMGL